MPNKDMWMGVGKQVLTFVVGIITASFILGGARQKMNDVYHWKMEMAPRIERMDSVGTLSFEHFHQEYMRTQARQEEKLKELEGITKTFWGVERLREMEKHTNEIEPLKYRVDALERRQKP